MARRTTIALIITALWFAVAALHAYESWSHLGRWEVAQLNELVFDNSVEVAFFLLVLGYIWLVLGYFQHRAELRQHSTDILRTAERADAALRMLEHEGQKFDAYQQKRIREAQPRWEVQGCIAHKEQHEISLTNAGAMASRIRAIWNQQLPMAVLVSNATVVERGQQLTIKVMFREARLDKFDLTLEYSDALGDLRRARVDVSEATVTIHHEE